MRDAARKDDEWANRSQIIIFLSDPPLMGATAVYKMAKRDFGPAVWGVSSWVMRNRARRQHINRPSGTGGTDGAVGQAGKRSHVMLALVRDAARKDDEWTNRA